MAVLVSALAAGAAPPAPSDAHVHVVAPGDSLWSIARHYGVTVDALVAANRLTSARVTLKVGQGLAVPGDGAWKAGPMPRRATRNLREARGPVNLVLAVPDFVEEAPHFLWPADGPITSTFGRRRNGWHRGVDIRGARGNPITAAAAGVVVVSGVEPRYGRVVKIEHDGGFITVYAHNERNLVAVGDEVDAGTLIGRMGRTGRATAEHVHFEIRRDGRVYNPLYLLPLPPRIGRVDDMESGEDDE